MAHYETWYPVSWLFSLLFGYNIGTLQYEFLFNLFIAGIGFYKLSSLFTGLEKSARVIGAISYMLCGVFIAQASQLGYITSGAWMTFVFYYLIVFLRQPNFKNGIYLTFFYYLLITGGYAGNFIVITYLCFLITVIFIIKRIYNKQKSELKPLLIYVPVFAIVLLLMYLVVLVPSLELQNYMTRTQLDYTNEGFGAMTGSTDLNGYLTLITPSAACSKNPFWGDYFMLNDVYFGVFNFLVFVYFLIRARKSQFYKLAWIFFVSALIFLMISVATVFPIHKWLYQMIPFFDRFRFPSLFRIFFVMQLIFIVMFGWQWIKENEKARREFGYFILGLVLVAIIALFFVSDPNLSLNSLISDFSVEILQLNQAGFLLIDLLIILFLGVIWFFGKNVNTSKLPQLILIVLIADLGLHTWVRSPRFVSSEKDPGEISDVLNKIPEGFPLINQCISIGKAHTQFQPIDELWLNTYVYYKYPMPEGSSPYSTIMYRDAIQSGNNEKMLQFPLIAVFHELNNQTIQTHHFLKEESQAIVSLSTGPNEFKFHVNDCAGKKLVFNHNYYPHWNFYENGKKLETEIADGNYCAFQLQGNDSDLVIRFEPTNVFYAFYISAITFCLVSLLLLWLEFRWLITRTKK
ncbi:MAG: hypothetical protein IPO32_03075 [Crocinitomicaceae bacterium]|nr:hypothetical protein [Crocinitomicaceae bacterium]